MTSGRRVHERYALELPITLTYPGGEATGTTKNVSLGGALVAVDKDIAFGSEVKVRMYLPPLKEDASFGATVRWRRDGRLGLQFGSLRAKEVWALNQMFKDASIL